MFIDTDIGSDCDDAGALQVVHTLCSRGFSELIGVTHCTSSVFGLPTISAVNRANKREVPLGTTRRSGFLDSDNCMRYTRDVARLFDHEFKDGAPQPDARDVFRRTLENQPDGSVTVLSTGPMNNLADYLGEAYLAGLIQRKVVRLVSMAGRFDCETPEWNVQMDIPAAQTVLDRWPTPVVMCGWECGKGVITGGVLAERPNHPVREAYRLWTGGTFLRDSYDLVTALYAVAGESEWVGTSRSGNILVDSSGITRFSPDPNGTRRYTILIASKEELAEHLNSLL